MWLTVPLGRDVLFHESIGPPRKKARGRFSEYKICLMVRGFFFFPFSHFLSERRKNFRERAPEPQFHLWLYSCHSWVPATLPYIGLFLSTGYGQCLCPEAPSVHNPDRKFPEQAAFVTGDSNCYCDGGCTVIIEITVEWGGH